MVVIAVEEYERLRRTEPAAAPNLIEENPIEEPRPARPTPDGGALHVPIRPENKTGVPDFIDYLLAIPKAPDTTHSWPRTEQTDPPDDLFERIPLKPCVTWSFDVSEHRTSPNAYEHGFRGALHQ